MVVLFILGLPGSGKSTAARHIVEHVKQHYKGWSTVRINDYNILYEMSRADKEGKRFSTTTYDGYDGFDVLDHSAFDDALWRLRKRAIEEKEPFAKRKLIIVEFARDNYGKALRKFFPEFLKDSYFLFIDAEVSICTRRIQERVSKPSEELIQEDDRYVSPFIFETYYQRDNRQYFDSVATQLKEKFGASESHVEVIEDSNLLQGEFEKQVEAFVTPVLQPERVFQPKRVKQFAQSQLYKRSYTRPSLLVSSH